MACFVRAIKRWIIFIAVVCAVHDDHRAQDTIMLNTSSNQLLLFGRNLITNDTDTGIIDNGAVVCEGEEILQVGTYNEMKNQFPLAREMGSTSQVVMPGLVNAHGHGRGLSYIQKGYLDTPYELWGERKRGLDPYHDALFSALKLIRSGVTTTLVHRSGRNIERLRAFADSGLRVVFALAITDLSEFVYEIETSFLDTLPSHIRSKAEKSASTPLPYSEYFGLVEELIEKYKDNPRVGIQYGPVSPQWCSRKLLGDISQKAYENKIAIHMHILETIYQREFALRKFGKTSVEYLDEIGFLGPHVTMAHLVWPTEKDISILQSKHVNVVHNPSSNLVNWDGIMPLKQVKSAGVNVGLGMDDSGINDDDDMFMEMRLCMRLHREPGLDSHSLHSHDMFHMATLGGAKCLSMDNTIGSIVPGKVADIILVDYAMATDPYIEPSIDVVDGTVYRVKREHVRTVVVGGNVLMEEGNITCLDERGVMKNLRKSAEAGQQAQFKAVDESWDELLPFVREYYMDWWKRDQSKPYYIFNSK